MREWMIAMFIIGALLIILDMAKLFVNAKRIKCKGILIGGEYPQRERVKHYAEAFRHLSELYYGMPYRKDSLSEEQLNHVLEEVSLKVCSRCYQNGICWGEKLEETYKAVSLFIRNMEEKDAKELEENWRDTCSKPNEFLESLEIQFREERQNLIWSNQMVESRLAVAQQMKEIAAMMENVADDFCDVAVADPKLQEEIRKKLRKKNIEVQQIWMPAQKKSGRKKIFLTVRTKKGPCVGTQEVVKALSEVFSCTLCLSKNSRAVINGEFHTIMLQEETVYRIAYGSAQIPKQEEQISGDNYLCREENQSQFVLCLSDGMGSGIEASKESEAVVELLERFLDSGFTEETSARMVNSALLLKRQDGSFSSIDICAIDLYSGNCRFLKAGAASTYIKRDHWVEVISSTNLGLGLVQQLEFEMCEKKLYHGDYLIMVTDGILNALPRGREEETMKEIILDVQEDGPKDLARGILEHVLGYSDYKAKDDMTVLTAGIWKK